MIDSVADAKAILVTALTDAGVDSNGVGVAKAGVPFYDHETQPGTAPRAGFVTISTAGINADFYQIAVRVYVGWENDIRAAQTRLDDLVQAVDADLPIGAGPGDWTVEDRDDLGEMLVMLTVASVGREDF